MSLLLGTLSQRHALLCRTLSPLLPASRSSSARWRAERRRDAAHSQRSISTCASSAVPVSVDDASAAAASAVEDECTLTGGDRIDCDEAEEVDAGMDFMDGRDEQQRRARLKTWLLVRLVEWMDTGGASPCWASPRSPSLRPSALLSVWWRLQSRRTQLKLSTRWWSRLVRFIVSSAHRLALTLRPLRAVLLHGTRARAASWLSHSHSAPNHAKGSTTATVAADLATIPLMLWLSLPTTHKHLFSSSTAVAAAALTSLRSVHHSQCNAFWSSLSLRQQSPRHRFAPAYQLHHAAMAAEMPLSTYAPALAIKPTGPHPVAVLAPAAHRQASVSATVATAITTTATATAAAALPSPDASAAPASAPAPVSLYAATSFPQRTKESIYQLSFMITDFLPPDTGIDASVERIRLQHYAFGSVASADAFLAKLDECFASQEITSLLLLKALQGVAQILTFEDRLVCERVFDTLLAQLTRYTLAHPDTRIVAASHVELLLRLLPHVSAYALPAALYLVFVQAPAWGVQPTAGIVAALFKAWNVHYSSLRRYHETSVRSTLYLPPAKTVLSLNMAEIMANPGAAPLLPAPQWPGLNHIPTDELVVFKCLERDSAGDQVAETARRFLATQPALFRSNLLLLSLVSLATTCFTKLQTILDILLHAERTANARFSDALVDGLAQVIRRDFPRKPPTPEARALLLSFLDRHQVSCSFYTIDKLRLALQLPARDVAALQRNSVRFQFPTTHDAFLEYIQVVTEYRPPASAHVSLLSHLPTATFDFLSVEERLVAAQRVIGKVESHAPSSTPFSSASRSTTTTTSSSSSLPPSSSSLPPSSSSSPPSPSPLRAEASLLAVFNAFFMCVSILACNSKGAELIRPALASLQARGVALDSRSLSYILPVYSSCHYYEEIIQIVTAFEQPPTYLPLRSVLATAVSCAATGSVSALEKLAKMMRENRFTLSVDIQKLFVATFKAAQHPSPVAAALSLVTKERLLVSPDALEHWPRPSALDANPLSAVSASEAALVCDTLDGAGVEEGLHPPTHLRRSRSKLADAQSVEKSLTSAIASLRTSAAASPPLAEKDRYAALDSTLRAAREEGVVLNAVIIESALDFVSSPPSSSSLRLCLALARTLIGDLPQGTHSDVVARTTHGTHLATSPFNIARVYRPLLRLALLQDNLKDGLGLLYCMLANDPSISSARAFKGTLATSLVPHIERTLCLSHNFPSKILGRHLLPLLHAPFYSMSSLAVFGLQSQLLYTCRQHKYTLSSLGDPRIPAWIVFSTFCSHFKLPLEQLDFTKAVEMLKSLRDNHLSLHLAAREIWSTLTAQVHASQSLSSAPQQLRFALQTASSFEQRAAPILLPLTQQLANQLLDTFRRMKEYHNCLILFKLMMEGQLGPNCRPDVFSISASLQCIAEEQGLAVVVETARLLQSVLPGVVLDDAAFCGVLSAFAARADLKAAFKPADVMTQAAALLGHQIETLRRDPVASPAFALALLLRMDVDATVATTRVLSLLPLPLSSLCTYHLLSFTHAKHPSSFGTVLEIVRRPAYRLRDSVEVECLLLRHALSGGAADIRAASACLSRIEAAVYEQASALGPAETRGTLQQQYLRVVQNSPPHGSVHPSHTLPATLQWLFDEAHGLLGREKGDTRFADDLRRLVDRLAAMWTLARVNA